MREDIDADVVKFVGYLDHLVGTGSCQRAVADVVVNELFSTLSMVCAGRLPPPIIGPSDSGGLVMQWLSRSLWVEIDINDRGRGGFTVASPSRKERLGLTPYLDELSLDLIVAICAPALETMYAPAARSSPWSVKP